jgi:hypothetical protein
MKARQYASVRFAPIGAVNASQSRAVTICCQVIDAGSFLATEQSRRISDRTPFLVRIFTQFDASFGNLRLPACIRDAKSRPGAE